MLRARRRVGTGRIAVSALLGTPVRNPSGEFLGRVSDLVVDLRENLERVPVSQVLLRRRGQAVAGTSWTSLSPGEGGASLVLTGALAPVEPVSDTQLLVRRDILDAPVVLVDPPRRARVSDVVLDAQEHGAWVVELDVSAGGAWRRLLRRPHTAVEAPVRLSEVHLASPAGHSAQLRVPGALVFGLGPHAMAELLTRVSVAHVRDILQVADPQTSGQAVSLLHPHVRARVTGASPPPRRLRRLAGWRVRHPDRDGSEGDRR